jgi:hypothetical protein
MVRGVGMGETSWRSSCCSPRGLTCDGDRGKGLISFLLLISPLPDCRMFAP